MDHTHRGTRLVVDGNEAEGGKSEPENHGLLTIFFFLNIQLLELVTVIEHQLYRKYNLANQTKQLNLIQSGISHMLHKVIMVVGND